MALEIPLQEYIIFFVLRTVLEVRLHVSSLSLTHVGLFILIPLSQAMIREVNFFLLRRELYIWMEFLLVLAFASFEPSLST